MKMIALVNNLKKNEHKLGADDFETMENKVAAIEKVLGIYDLLQFTPGVKILKISQVIRSRIIEIHPMEHTFINERYQQIISGIQAYSVLFLIISLLRKVDYFLLSISLLSSTKFWLI